LNYQEFRKKKMKQYAIQEVCWGVPLPGERVKYMSAPGFYTVSYVRTGKQFWVRGPTFLSEYVIESMEFCEVIDE
jgi:hypothetical protein